MKPQADNAAQRKSRLAALHIRAREVGLIEGDDKTAWRKWLADGFSGIDSSAKLSDTQLAAALNALKGGAKPTGRALHDEINRRLQALDKSEGYAVGIARKMFGKDRLQFCDDIELRKIVAALAASQRRAEKKHGSPRHA
ncbi:phage protein GemA/Gp16 family protein [Hydrocarboniphaga effusa]|uniref:phage protein GemA/Gp16 family protein n=1 Tax=Hydrocarboniphaga effusa TaxID=243629 RepID=UPI003BAA9171